MPQRKRKLKPKKRKPSSHTWGDGYLTLGWNVYLGPRPPKWVIENARKAGLTPISLRELKAMHSLMQAIQIIDCNGTWVNSVKYKNAF